MNMTRSKNRSRNQWTPSAERLEGRELMTAGAGNTFAIIPGTITDPATPVEVPVSISTQNFGLPRRAVTLGIDVAAPSGSAVQPLISAVNDPHGNLNSQTFHSVYNPHLAPQAVAAGAASSAVLSPMGLLPRQPTAPSTYTVVVTSQNAASGQFLLGFYLPGDANGDGTVTKSDYQSIRSELGARAGDSNYNFSADANRDGRIGLIDLAFTRQNMGVSTNLSPVISANLQATPNTDAATRATSDSSVTFSGQTSGGASVTFAPVGTTQTPVSTMADSMGNYSVVVPLVEGQNLFQVTSTDAFGQTISGIISPVTYTPRKS